MAQGKWVNIPGKGRRWQQPSGELMMEKPGIGFVQAQLSPVTGFLGSIFKSSGLPAYQMSGPGLQQLRQQQTQDYYRQRGLSSLGPEYKEQELAAGQAAENFRPGAGFPGQQAERAYQQEKSRVEQLTKQDPELQRYEKARAGAKTQQEMDAARDIGMAIWAAKHGGPGGLASKVKPGQSGYEVIQNELNAGQMGPVMDLPFDTTRPFSPTPVPPEQLSVTYEGARPASLGEVTPIVGGGFPTEQAAMFERFQQAISPSQPTFQGSPLGTGTPLVGNLAYTGSIAPLGTAVEGGNFRSDKAQKLAEMFKKAQFSS